MLIALLAYAAVMLAVGLYHVRHVGSFREFVIAGGRQGSGLVTLSLLASMIGGSATLGLADLTLKLGFPAFWWLGVGSAGCCFRPGCCRPGFGIWGPALCPMWRALPWGPRPALSPA